MIFAVPLFALTSSAIGTFCNRKLKDKGYIVTEKEAYKSVIDDAFEFRDEEITDGEYALQDDTIDE